MLDLCAFIFITVNILNLVKSMDNLNIPREVLDRYGGITSLLKKDLFDKHQSLGFVYIPDFLKTQIIGLPSLERYGVCKTPTTLSSIKEAYFVCPTIQPSSSSVVGEDLRFCCGHADNQYCCNLADFKANIRIISSTLVISPSIVIGTCLAILMVSTAFVILIYSRIARGLRKQSVNLRNQSYSLGLVKPTESHVSSSSSYVPPRKRLISGYSKSDKYQNVSDGPASQTPVASLPKKQKRNKVDNVRELPNVLPPSTRLLSAHNGPPVETRAAKKKIIKR